MMSKYVKFCDPNRAIVTIEADTDVIDNIVTELGGQCLPGFKFDGHIYVGDLAVDKLKKSIDNIK